MSYRVRRGLGAAGSVQTLGVCWGAAVGLGGSLLSCVMNPHSQSPTDPPGMPGQLRQRWHGQRCPPAPASSVWVSPEHAGSGPSLCQGSAGFCTPLRAGAFPTHPCVLLSLGRHPGELLPSHSWPNPRGASVLIPRGALGCLLGMSRGVWPLISPWSCSALLPSLPALPEGWVVPPGCPGARVECVGKGCGSSCSGHRNDSLGMRGIKISPGAASHSAPWGSSASPPQPSCLFLGCHLLAPLMGGFYK